ncbi:MAG: phosphatidate cytidylyltransferase [Chakrabartia sp.]
MTPELIQRTLAGLVLILIAALELWLGGNALWVLATIIGLIMIREWARLTGGMDQRRLGQYALCLPLGLLSPLAAGPGPVSALGFLVALLIILIVSRNLWFSAGVIYVGMPVTALLWLRMQEDGLMLSFWALSLVWATDIGAYFAGRTFGGPKIAPKISPNKTWSGLIGGMLGALLLAGILVVDAGLSPRLAWASPALALLAQIGDFFESWMKRRAGVKDSGTLIPGHGGALDRLDGVVPALPAAALLVWLGLQAG